MKPRHPVSQDDSRLFREAIADVREFEPVPLPPAMPKPAPYPHRLKTSAAAAPSELRQMSFDPEWLEVGEELSYLCKGYSPKWLRQLKRGQFSVQDDLDLHRMKAAAAQVSIDDFLAAAKRHGLHCVRIVHGKGLRSRAAGPVLKGLTDRMLRQRSDVIAFASARPSLGGTGAVIVLLKDSKT